jgi:membrane associated rhomboid family serine protease
MLLPIGDENPRERTPYVNYVLLGANIAAFLLTAFDREVVARYALVASRPEPLTFVTSMFLHANLMHLAGNMVFLWIFGDNVEDRLGHLGYAAFYLAAGLAAAFLQLATLPARVPELESIGLSPRDVPMLGASGAISGVVGAYVVFFPRHQVKLLVFFGFWIQTFLVPAFWWIGFWFAEQLLFSRLGYSGVAYMAHIGGFLAGLGAGGIARAVQSGSRPSAPVPEEIREASRGGPGRGPFITLADAPEIEWVDEPPERWAVLRLADALPGVSRVAKVTAATTGERPAEVADRLQSSRGLIAKGLPRSGAERVVRDLRGLGVPAAAVPIDRSTLPPVPARVEAARWDASVLQLRVRGREVHVPWPTPFLYLGARVEGTPFIDLLLGRREAFRLALADPADLADLARAIVARREGAALNEGVRVLAHGGSWGWLSFRSHSQYDDYVFWVYNLILSRVPVHRV